MINGQLETIDIEAAAVSPSGIPWRDIMGMGASIGCAIHCAAMPIVIGYLPVLGLEFLADESFHKWMVLVCLGIALMAFIPAWKKHRKLKPAMVGVVGLSLIASAAFVIPDTCCAACAVDADQVGSVALVSDDSTDGDSEAEAVVCTEACCQPVDGAPGTSENDGSSSEQSAALSSDAASQPFYAFLLPWLTPLGGMVLVGAHLLNHRYSCKCQCCG